MYIDIAYVDLEPIHEQSRDEKVYNIEYSW